MKRAIQVWFCLLSVSLCAPPEPATLRWKNGESIAGEIIEGTADDLTWKSPMFEEPVVLAWHALRRIDQTRAAVPVTDAFIIAFRNGDVIQGDVLSIAETAINLRSKRHGDIAVKRSEVSSIKRLRGGDVVYSGPTGDVGWELATTRKDVEIQGGTALRTIRVPWLVTGPRGALSMPYWNSGASLKVTVPTKAEVEFLVRSSTRPGFVLSLFGGDEERLRVETWEDELVLVSGKAFKKIRQVADTEREVGLRLCWDRPARTCSVFTLAGEPLTEWQVPQAENTNAKSSCVQIMSKGRDLSLEALRIRAWNGRAPARHDPTRPRVEMADGTVLDGHVRDGTAVAITFATVGEGPTNVVPFDQVAMIIFSTDEPKVTEQPSALSFADGTRITGRVVSVKDGRITLETSISGQLLAASLENLRQWLIRVPAPEGSEPELPVTKLDRIVGTRSMLRGKLSGIGDNSPRWLPVGGLKPVKPAKEFAQEIIRAVPASDGKPGAPALFYTTSGDVLPGGLRSLDQKQVELESGIITNTKLPVEYLDAIQFSANAGKGIKGFNDPGWRVLKGGAEKVVRTGDTLKMQPETSIGHPAGMLSSEVNFEYHTSGYSAVRLRMFCSGLDTQKSVNLVLMRMSGQITSGIEGIEGQFNEETSTPVPSSDPVLVRIAIQQKDFALYINGGLVQKFPIAGARRVGAGLIVEPTSMWGNAVSSIELAKFVAKSDPGATWLPEIDTEAKMQALTVPRFRKENPPRHALLAANGDVLRGVIESATETHFGFRSGLETLRVPRDRVKAAIWLKKPDPNAPPLERANPTRDKLDRKITQQINYGGANVESLVNFLSEEAGDIQFKLPEKANQRGVDIQLGGGQTIGEALEEICRLFGLTYRVDKNGTIVLEEPAKERSDLVQKVYWLKGSALPADGSEKKVLAEKGISFPEGASVLWRSELQQLTMTNTVANQEELTKLIGAEFRDSIGAPTHWLILSNGGRIGFLVERFDAEWIAGKHPQYGECKVPVKDVFAIRTTPPEATLAMRSLANWRLVHAPEPILPETGGENSQTLGKEAKTFKLPMLAGGDFDLAKEKGKVVVLDFWATWCGPCIKSLPGLIKAMSNFPADRVKFIGVNQGEPPDQVKTFLKTRKWKLDVVLDASQTVGRQYEVEGIPHTVVIAPDGKIAYVQSGASPQGEILIANAVKQLLSTMSAPSGAQ
jgi:thiol-disulfide isomerase/thioredoxin